MNATLVDHGILTEIESSEVPDQYTAVVEIMPKRWGVGIRVEVVTKLVRLPLGFDN